MNSTTFQFCSFSVSRQIVVQGHLSWTETPARQKLLILRLSSKDPLPSYFSGFTHLEEEFINGYQMSIKKFSSHHFQLN